MDLIDFCTQVLFSKTLEAKLTFPENIAISDSYQGNQDIVEQPSRSPKTQFSTKQVKFPKKNQLEIDEKKAIAFNAFANHELLAIEIMAYTLRYLPHHTEEDRKFKRAILSTIKDEQKHFKLYQKRLNELGYEFGDFPINDFFWKQVSSIKSKESYLALMALTFESANLDFASYYRDIFKELGDHQSAEIMDVVYQDEISHVALGGHYFEKWREDISLWEYYQTHLPWPMTPARAKGIVFNQQARVKAKLGSDYINQLKEYKDNFPVTHRKAWK